VSNAKKRSLEPTIEMLDGLPRFQEDDLAFILRELPRLAPCSISTFIEKIGLQSRSFTSGAPSSIYHRLSGAFRKGLAEGKLLKNGGRKSWRVAP
jgi:hypothetical protein